jgi:pilus assembly protein Flp/PilA
MRLIRRLVEDERGATALEYGLLAALLGVVICGAVTVLGTKLYTAMGNISNALH